jgi:two-component system, NarL family, response regulator NreC
VSKARILIADDHTLVRHGLRRILEEQRDWQIVAQANDGREAVARALSEQPDVAILDIGMSLLNGIEATRQITRRLPSVHVLIVSMHAEQAYVTAAVQAGARGYLLKDSMDTDLISAVESVLSGRSFFSPVVSKIMLDEYVAQLASKGIVDRYDALSQREREVLQLIAEGHSNKETASLLSISPATVETHRARIFEKLGVHNTAELVLYAVRRGVIS